MPKRVQRQASKDFFGGRGGGRGSGEGSGQKEGGQILTQNPTK